MMDEVALRGQVLRRASKFMQRKITRFFQDQHHDWVAELECKHTHHIRHNPPFQDRAWVLTPEGRQKFIGVPIHCTQCDSSAPPPTDSPDSGA